ncbi:MAG TPA: DNA translocase FtsK 4TM domain-containing protein [Opitutaceae bacterium]|nr:DNA translocase FtsK 4TM domain-containing protein [Opitutaceae bacterium]
MICFVLGVLLLAAFLDYDPSQSPVDSTNPAGNIVGKFGAYAGWLSFSSLGWATWLLPIFLLWLTYLALREPRQITGLRLGAMAVCLFSACGLAGLFEVIPQSTGYLHHGYGGLIGVALYRGLLRKVVGDFGTVMILGAVYLVCLLFIFTRDIGVELEKVMAGLSAWREQRAARKARLQSERDAAALARRREMPRNSEPAPAKAPLVLTPVNPENKNVLVAKPAEPKVPPPRAPEAKPAAKAEPRAPAPPAKPAKLELNIVKPEESRKAKAAARPAADDRYVFPPLKLLKEQVRPSALHSEEEHRRNAENLLRILGEFGVEVTLGEIHVGPVITRYEVVPAAGVRVEKISGLDKNIALGMRAQSVRILAPIPGKAAVGVEVPNQNPTPVGLREIIEAEEWSNSRAEIPIALGKDVSGKPLISDLTKMPHLLIAGATGSGKSVCINAIVASILYSKSPKDVRLIMVDPKVVELKIFNSLPQMLIPVLTEPKKVPAALKWLLREMEQRYQMFGKVNVRNIVGFNNRKKGAAAEPPPAAEEQGALSGLDPAADDTIEIPERLPYIVAIIDELADLMAVAPAEIETNIARLAQLARAAGIHLIIATQRPSVNVVTGVIKANLPSRIAFQVASQVDSRTIIDTKGADTLIGRGDMLFTPPGTSRIVRAQGAFVADEEVQAMVDFLKENNDPPLYAQEVQQHIDRTAREDDEDGDDFDGEDGEMGDDGELFAQAIDVLKSSRRASTSMLQRRLKIGYNRAARIMELMEEKGIVGPENGSSPREILVDLDTL